MSLRWYTINDDRDGNGHLWREGRLILGSRYSSDATSACISWCHRPRMSIWVGIEVGAGDSDKGLQFHVDLLGLRYWLTLEGPWTRWLCSRVLPSHTSQYLEKPIKLYEPREITVYIVEGHAHWALWQSPWEWSSETPRWRNGGFFLEDVLLGRARYSKVDVGGPVKGIASFPEGSYELTLQREVATWKRPRWPWKLTREYTDIRVERPPAFQGKGENSWDCGDDGIYGMSSKGHSLEHAIATYTEAVLKNRSRYGHVSKEHRAVEAMVA